MDDKQKAELGEKFAVILMLKEDHWEEEKKYKTLHGIKTNLGIYDLIVSLGVTAQTGKFR